MQLLIYCLAYPFLWIVSILPFRVLYWVSDVVFVILYYLVGYRKKVVLENLKLTLPEKDLSELKEIRKRFYRHMCDVFLEMGKGMGLSKEEVTKRFAFQNVALLKQAEESGKVLIMTAHYANWEWSPSVNLWVDESEGYAVYQKINNVYFDRLIKRIRSQWNTTLITQQETIKTVMGNAKNNISAIYGIVSDQSPMAIKATYWHPFMGITVPVYTGAEALARKLDMVVLFQRVKKVKRGYYEITYVPITFNGKDTEKHFITNKFLEETEKLIREAPEYYLWTHKRWKHRNRVPEQFQ